MIFDHIREPRLVCLELANSEYHSDMMDSTYRRGILYPRATKIGVQAMSVVAFCVLCCSMCFGSKFTTQNLFAVVSPLLLRHMR